MEKVHDGRGRVRDASDFPAIAVGTMVSSNLDRARKFYEEFFGFECVRYAPDRMMLRDSVAKRLMEEGRPGAFVIDVREVDAIEHPQCMLNHWGFSVDSWEEVERIRAVALERQEEFGIKKVHPITKMHNSYQFYFSDVDENWWEVECRPEGRTMNSVFEEGDFRRKSKGEAEVHS